MILSSRTLNVEYLHLKCKCLNGEFLEKGSVNPEKLLSNTFFDSENYILGQAKVKIIDYCSDESKNKPTFVLVGGLAVNLYDWQDFIVALSKFGRVVAVDILGTKFSDYKHYEFYQSLDSQTNVLNQVFSLLDISKAVLIGHSMGGVVVEAFTRFFPEKVSRLVLLDGSFEQNVRDIDYVLHDNLPRRRFNLFSGLVSRALFSLNNFYIGRKFFAQIACLLRFRELKTLTKGEMKKLLVTGFVEEDSMLAILSYGKSYDLWFSQLNDFKKPLAVPTLIVGATMSKYGKENHWIHLLKKKTSLLSEKEKAEAKFVKVYASHMLMRDIPVHLSKIIKNFI